MNRYTHVLQLISDKRNARSHMYINIKTQTEKEKKKQNDKTEEKKPMLNILRHAN